MATKPRRRRWGRAPLSLIAAGVLIACSAGARVPGITTSAPASTAQELRPVTAVTPAQLAAAATVVGARLATSGLPGATVTVEHGQLTVNGLVDPYRLEAAARRGPTTLVRVASITPGPCNGTGVPSTPPGRRCYQLGPPIATTDAVAETAAEVGDGSGWAVRLRIVSAQYQLWRAALATVPNDAAIAVVSDGAVITAFSADGVPGLSDRLGPAMDEAEARRLAAALVVHDDAGAAFVAPSPPDLVGPVVHTDFWLASLDVNVCGSWLSSAPAVANDTGLHSHGDGFVYVHPFASQEAQEHATLGLFLRRGSWSVSDEELHTWDGAVHRRLDHCPDGTAAVITFRVDGVQQTGDPMAWRVRSNQTLTLSFNPPGVNPGTGPAAGRLPLPRLSAVAG